MFALPSLFDLAALSVFRLVELIILWNGGTVLIGEN
jgi:hypothetical protein